MADLINEWLAARADWADATAGARPVSECNQLMDRERALAREIAGHVELHQAITNLCDSAQDPDLRLGAALVREHWDLEGAAKTLLSVIDDSGASVTRPITMSIALSVGTDTTARTAALCLFNIDSGRGNTGTH